MADFTSAAQFVGRPQVQLEDPMQAQMKAASLAQAMQQQQIGAVQLANAQREAEDMATFRKNLQSGMSTMDAARSTGNPAFIQKTALSEMETQRAKLAFQNELKTMNENERKEMKDINDSLGAGAKTALSIEDPTARYSHWERVLSDTIQNRLQPVASDSPKQAQMRSSSLQHYQQMYDNLGNLTGIQDMDSMLNHEFNQSKQLGDWLKEDQQKGPKLQHIATATGFATFNPETGEIVPIKGAPKPLPTQAQVNISQMPSPNADYNAPLADKSEEAAAQRLAKSGDRETPGQRNPRARTINARADAISESLGFGSATDRKKAVAADSKSLEKLTSTYDSITAFEKTASKNLQMAVDLSKTLIDTGSPYLNRPFRSLDKNLFGGKDQANFEAALRVANTEIAKVNTNPNLTGVLSDTARHEIDAINSPNATLGQVLSVSKILLQDMKNRKESTSDQINEVKQRIKGGSPAANQTKTLSPVEINKLPPSVANAYNSGKVVTGPDGTRYKKEQ